jgi:tetratricopeptide (TPR) repeat protein
LQGRPREAERACRKAIDLYPSQLAHQYLGLLLANQGDLAAAVQAFKDAADLGSELSAYNVYLTLDQMGKGQSDEARDYLMRAATAGVPEALVALQGGESWSALPDDGTP